VLPPVSVVALELPDSPPEPAELPVVLPPAPAPAPAAPLVWPELMLDPVVLLPIDPVPGVPLGPPGFTAPSWPAVVDGGRRPALSDVPGPGCDCANAPATAADMQPASTASMTFLITTSREG
jgi:hypothetical protein